MTNRYFRYVGLCLILTVPTVCLADKASRRYKHYNPNWMNEQAADRAETFIWATQPEILVVPVPQISQYPGYPARHPRTGQILSPHTAYYLYGPGYGVPKPYDGPKLKMNGGTWVPFRTPYGAQYRRVD